MEHNQWRPQGLIGVVHLPAMPGDPRATASFREIEAFAWRDAEHLARGGCDAIIVENFGSAPFPKGDPQNRIPPHQCALMALFVRRCVAHLGLPVGVNCLRNDIFSALGIAAAADAAFVRVNVHTGAYLTDQGIIEGEAYASLRYRQQLGQEHVTICADILVKHAAPLTPLDPQSATKDTLERGLADAVIVTGQATGAPVDPARLAEVRAAAKNCPVIIGSGVSPQTLPVLKPHADAFIVGTWLKEEGKVANPVDIDRVKEMSTLLRR